MNIHAHGYKLQDLDLIEFNSFIIIEMNKAKEFWGNFGIKGDNFLTIIRRLNKPDLRELTTKEKIGFIKNNYREKVENGVNIINEEQKKLNKIKLRLNMENSKLIRRKNEEKFFRNEDNILKYEELINPIQNKINKHKKILNENLFILNKLMSYK